MGGRAAGAHPGQTAISAATPVTPPHSCLPKPSIIASVPRCGRQHICYGLIGLVTGGWLASVPQPSLVQLGTAIRTLREKRGLSIEALAGEAELHAVSISRIERGKQNASWIALLSIATVLDVEMLDLVKLAVKQPRAKP